MSWLDRLRGGFAKTAERVADNLTGLTSRAALDTATLDDIEEALIASDLGPEASHRIREAIARQKFERLDERGLRSILAEEIEKILAPVAKPLEVHSDDVVIYDAEGYDLLKQFLQKQGIRHVLLTGYHADMCVCKTTAGYENLAKDFNVFLVGDATMATFPANLSPKAATNATLSFAALRQFITQVSWVRYSGQAQTKR